MTAWPSSIDVITLITDDLAATKSFYEEVFERTCVYEDENSAVFNFDNIMVNLLVATAADDLVTPTPVAPSSAGARFQFTVGVEDVDATCALLTEKGVQLNNGPMDRPWGIRTASFFDPGGHLWEIARDLS